MRNKKLVNFENVPKVRNVEEVARRALALGVLLDRMAAELRYWSETHDDDEYVFEQVVEHTVEHMMKYHSSAEVGSWLFETGLITSLEPWEVEAISQPFGCWVSEEGLIPVSVSYIEFEILLWALSYLEKLPSTPYELLVDSSKLVNIGYPVSQFISSVQLRDISEIREALNSARDVMLDCTSQDPKLLIHFWASWVFHSMAIENQSGRHALHQMVAPRVAQALPQ